EVVDVREVFFRVLVARGHPNTTLALHAAARPERHALPLAHVPRPLAELFRDGQVGALRDHLGVHRAAGAAAVIEVRAARRVRDVVWVVVAVANTTIEPLGQGFPTDAELAEGRGRRLVVVGVDGGD